MSIGDKIRMYREQLGMSQEELAKKVGFETRGAISKIELGRRDVSAPLIEKISIALNISPSDLFNDTKLNSPTITEDTVTYPVIGEVAAGYDKIAVEDWDGDTVEIPTEYLRGRNRDEFFVLRVKGDSMYPLYMDGDKVLVLKQSTLDHSGDIGVMIYDGECGTLKKVEYVMGEDWLKMIPINPNYQPIKIEGEDLERCRVLGVPRLLIREIEQ